MWGVYPAFHPFLVAITLVKKCRYKIPVVVTKLIVWFNTWFLLPCAQGIHRFPPFISGLYWSARAFEYHINLASSSIFLLNISLGCCLSPQVESILSLYVDVELVLSLKCVLNMSIVLILCLMPLADLLYLDSV